MKAFLVRWLITTIAVLVAVVLVDGIDVGTAGSGVIPLIAASLFLGIANALIRPVLLLLSFPLIILTMGLFIFVLNALLLLGVGQIVPGFHVGGFWAAFWGALIISFVSWVLSIYFRDSQGKIKIITHHQIQEDRTTGRPIKTVEGTVIETNKDS